MSKCALCGKSFKSNKSEFGLSCLKELCLSVGIDDVKNYSSEKILNKVVCKRLGKDNLSLEQNKILTDRYYCLKLLEDVKLSEYDKYRKSIQSDIDIINSFTNTNELKSFKKISLKESREVNKKYNKYKNIFEKINDGDYDAAQYITSGLIRFAFSKYYAKKPYLYDMRQKLQLFILKCGVFFLKLKKHNFAAECLEHSLKRNPKDMYITNGKVIDEIKSTSVFKNAIDRIVKKNSDKVSFYNEEIIKFESGDLFHALHNATLITDGKKYNDKWIINVSINDLYDFTELIKIQDYLSEEKGISGLPAAIGNNVALIGSNSNVVFKYNIRINFEIQV